MVLFYIVIEPEKRMWNKRKEDFKRKVVQKKLTQSWLQIPEREKEKFRSEEEKRKRLELKEVKENLWRWRNKPEDKVGKKRKWETEKRKSLEKISSEK